MALERREASRTSRVEPRGGVPPQSRPAAVQPPYSCWARCRRADRVLDPRSRLVPDRVRLVPHSGLSPSRARLLRDRRRHDAKCGAAVRVRQPSLSLFGAENRPFDRCLAKPRAPPRTRSQPSPRWTSWRTSRGRTLSIGGCATCRSTSRGSRRSCRRQRRCRAGERPTPRGVGRGVACAIYKEKSYVATVVEVEVDEATHHIAVRRAYCAHDCGLVVSPGSSQGADRRQRRLGLQHELCSKARRWTQAG